MRLIMPESFHGESVSKNTYTLAAERGLREGNKGGGKRSGHQSVYRRRSRSTHECTSVQDLLHATARDVDYVVGLNRNICCFRA